jgi:ribosomal protein S18 acetylase RimI-like enzyme
MEIRRYDAADREAVVALAPRLTEGVAPWRDPAAVRAAVVGWVVESLERAAEPDRLVLVAATDRDVVGFVAAVERRHWSGGRDAYIGELVVAADAEGKGTGRALVEAVTRWADERGLAQVTLETGAANQRARAFYERLGFVAEDIRLTRRMDGRTG